MKKLLLTLSFLALVLLLCFSFGCYHNERMVQDSYRGNEQSAQAAVTGSPDVLIDVRSEAEFNQGHLADAILLPHTVAAEKIQQLVPDKNQRIILYCRSGNRSGIVFNQLKKLGYNNVVDAGAFDDLKEKYPAVFPLLK